MSRKLATDYEVGTWVRYDGITMQVVDHDGQDALVLAGKIKSSNSEPYEVRIYVHPDEVYQVESRDILT